MGSMRCGIALVIAVGTVCLLGGCGIREVRYPESGADLEGTVSYNNEKVKVALVIVQGAGLSATGNINSDGSFKIKNVPIGEVSIGVNTDAGKGELRGKMMARAQTKEKVDLPKVIDIPPKFFSPATSGIKTTISKGPNKYDVILKR